MRMMVCMAPGFRLDISYITPALSRSDRCQEASPHRWEARPSTMLTPWGAVLAPVKGAQRPPPLEAGCVCETP